MSMWIQRCGILIFVMLGSASIVLSAPAAENQVMGTITAVDGPNMTLKKDDGSSIDLKVTVSTEVVGENVMGYGDLISGQAVTVDVVKARRGTGLVATKIHVRPSGEHDSHDADHGHDGGSGHGH